MRTLLLATTNQHKLEEYNAIFSHLPVILRSLREVPLEMDVEETGQTFAENARIKALAYAQATGMLSLADDSGLEIDALGGAPGILSARFAGRDTPYQERFRLILEQLKGLTGAQRAARFRCAIALAEPSGYCRVVEGVIEGVIADRPRGAGTPRAHHRPRRRAPWPRRADRTPWDGGPWRPRAGVPPRRRGRPRRSSP